MQLSFLASTFSHTPTILCIAEHPRVQGQSAKSQFYYVVRAVCQRDVNLASTQRDKNGYPIQNRKKKKGMAVDKDPNRHRSQASILGFRISETHDKKKKRKGTCYKLSKAKQVGSLVYETVTWLQIRSVRRYKNKSPASKIHLWQPTWQPNAALKVRNILCGEPLSSFQGWK